jgi:2-oxoglutarate dehydrogenase E2 component (dihydrolipoamide succinyltransferase)
MPVELKIPSLGESITEVQIGEWLKKEGAEVAKDENVVTIESDKATVELPAPTAGILKKILKPNGAAASVNDVIAEFEEHTGGSSGATKPREQTQVTERKTAGTKLPDKESLRGAPAKGHPGTNAQEKESSVPDKAGRAERQAAGSETKPRVMPAAEKLLAQHGLQPEEVTATGPGGRLLKEDVLRHVEVGPVEKETPEAVPEDSASDNARAEEVVPMSLLRRTVARRLVEAQHNAALLTTFNEIDMSSVIALRKEFQEIFQKKYGTKLGFMSFFVRAVVEALKQIPQLNGEVRGTDIVYRNYFDIGVAIGSGKGLVVPVLRSAERMSFAEVENAIADFARRAQENQLKPEELQGGTFTISNGGVYGSLLSTPIVNPPQSGVLGMHAIQERPVAVEGQVVVRPMMYVALTYDHRVVDGREAVTFLRRIKELIEKPARILMEV